VNADLELRRHLIEHRCMIKGTPAITITLPIQKPGAPDTLLVNEVSALGDAGQAQARLVHLGAGRLHPFVQDGERARIGVDRNTKRLSPRNRW